VVITGDMIDNHTDTIIRCLAMADHFKRKAIPSITSMGIMSGKPQKPSADQGIHDLFNGAGGHYLYQNSLTSGTWFISFGFRDPYTKSEGWHLGRYYGDIPEQLDQLQSSLDDSVCNLLLCHRPEYFDLAQKAGFELMLSGHTHGGQISFGAWNVALTPWSRYQKGRYDEKGNSLIVSSGLGYSYSLPMRYACDCQLVRLTIKSKD
jgi:predicted MPP superfamily phosphohydrolase